MPTIAPSYVPGTPTLLLMEPDTMRYSERAAELAKSSYRVTRVDDVRDLFLMRNVFYFSLAVLSDRVGVLALRASAQMVRGQWPKARIVLLGRAPDQFEDHLYDDSVVHASDGGALLEVLDKAMDDPWNQRSHDAYAAWLVRTRLGERPKQSGVLRESDPRKVSGPVREAQAARERPSGARMARTAR